VISFSLLKVKERVYLGFSGLGNWPKRGYRLTFSHPEQKKAFAASDIQV
jgi:hypothetical protein